MASDKNYCVILQELYSKQRITDQSRDIAKDMIFEEDTTLTLLFENNAEDYEQLAKEIEKYTNIDGIKQKRPPQVDTGVHVADDMNSPADSALDLMKRKRKL